MWLHGHGEYLTPSVHPALLVQTAHTSLQVGCSELVLHLPIHDPLHDHIALVLQAAVDAEDEGGQLYAEACRYDPQRLPQYYERYLSQLLDQSFFAWTTRGMDGMFVPRLVRSLLLTVEEIAYARACCLSYELTLRPLHPPV
jgi:hypothetical protein